MQIFRQLSVSPATAGPPSDCQNWQDQFGCLLGDEQFMHTRCFTIDVTELKNTEHALRESEELFKTAANTAPVLIWMADMNKDRYFFNGASFEIYLPVGQ